MSLPALSFFLSPSRSGVEGVDASRRPFVVVETDALSSTDFTETSSVKLDLLLSASLPTDDADDEGYYNDITTVVGRAPGHLDGELRVRQPWLDRLQGRVCEILPGRRDQLRRRHLPVPGKKPGRPVEPIRRVHMPGRRRLPARGLGRAATN